MIFPLSSRLTFSALILRPRSSPGARRRRKLLGLPDPPEVSPPQRQIQEVTLRNNLPQLLAQLHARRFFQAEWVAPQGLTPAGAPPEQAAPISPEKLKPMELPSWEEISNLLDNPAEAPKKVSGISHKLTVTEARHLQYVMC